MPETATSAQPTATERPAPEVPPQRRRPLFRLLQLVSLAAVAGLLALLIWRVASSGGGADLVSAISAGKEPSAPAFTLSVLWPHSETWPKALLPALADGKVSPTELRGYPVVVNFWASWCIPCKAEAPRFVASARSHAGQVAFLGIDIQDFSGDARSFLRRYHANYVSVRDGGGSTYPRYGLTGVPETYFIDRRGRIVAHVPGELLSKQLEEGVQLVIGGSR